MTEQKKDFFISYNGKDKDWAEWIAWQLEETGYSVVIQAWDFRPSGNFVLEMQKAAQAERTIMVLSPNYLAAQFTQPEWAAAFAQDPTGQKGNLLPVRVADCDLHGLLPAIIYIDLVDLVEAAAKEKLLAGVQRGRAKPSVPPRFPSSSQKQVERQSPHFPNSPSVIDSKNPSLQSNFTQSIRSITMEGTESSTGIKIGQVKIQLCQRLISDWQNLADYFEIPTADRACFEKGREPQQVWEWLESRGRLAELAEGLRFIDRSELADLLPKDLPNRPW